MADKEEFVEIKYSDELSRERLLDAAKQAAEEGKSLKIIKDGGMFGGDIESVVSAEDLQRAYENDTLEDTVIENAFGFGGDAVIIDTDYTPQEIADIKDEYIDDLNEKFDELLETLKDDKTPTQEHVYAIANYLSAFKDATSRAAEIAGDSTNYHTVREFKREVGTAGAGIDQMIHKLESFTDYLKKGGEIPEGELDNFIETIKEKLDPESVEDKFSMIEELINGQLIADNDDMQELIDEWADTNDDIEDANDYANDARLTSSPMKLA